MFIATLFIQLVVVAFSSTDAMLFWSPRAAQVCHDIRVGKIKILALGGISDKFYLLAKGGYLFNVKLDNLVLSTVDIDANKLRINGPYKAAYELFKNVDFSAELDDLGGFRKFFFISEGGKHYLGEMYSEKLIKASVWLYNLDDHKDKLTWDSKDQSGQISFLMSGLADTALAYQMVKVSGKGWSITWKYTVTVANGAISVDNNSNVLSGISSKVVYSAAFVTPDYLVFLANDESMVVTGKGYLDGIPNKTLHLNVKDFIKCELPDEEISFWSLLFYALVLSLVLGILLYAIRVMKHSFENLQPTNGGPNEKKQQLETEVTSTGPFTYDYTESSAQQAPKKIPFSK